MCCCSAPLAISTPAWAISLCPTAPSCAFAAAAARHWRNSAAMSRLRDRYRSEVIPALMKRFGYKNPMAVPKVAKVVVNIGLGEASQNIKLLDVAALELGQITGQKPTITRAKKSIANFKIRKGMPIGCCVNLRGDR